VAHQRSDADLVRLVGRNLRLLAGFIVPVAIAGSFAAEPAVTVLFGAAYAAGGTPLAVLLWSVVLAFLSSTVSYALAAAGRGWLLTTASAAGATVNVVLNLLLIPEFGMLGAAAATVAAEATVLAVVGRAARSLVEPAALIHLLRIVPAAALMVVVALVVNPISTWLAVAIGIGVYAAVAYAMSVWTRDDRQVIRGAIRLVVSRRI
jgi:O-antigen/teichoic acid export membrane protein